MKFPLKVRLTPQSRRCLHSSCHQVAHIILDDNCSRIFGFVPRFPPPPLCLCYISEIYISSIVLPWSGAFQTFHVSLLQFDSLFTNLPTRGHAACGMGHGAGGDMRWLPLRLAASCGRFSRPSPPHLTKELPNYVRKRRLKCRCELSILPRRIILNLI